ncbi:MAG: MFS transporter [Gammaproteobacteria bacterium]|nr:MFS transporter [Gammaproteobacteria bacterium]MCW8972817.1 MFS transporter [Gammaproteobacteria bacterium]MCW8992110.1 MFS transporter [Gammaproteobacteria bacterium]
MALIKNRKVLAWTLYDWGNSAFATTVMAGFFPVFFKQYWSAGAEVTDSTFQLGIANSVASLVIVLLAPVLGAIADSGSHRKRFLIFFAFLGICMTALLPLVAMGQWQWAVLFYVVATIGFSGSVTFYDSLIVFVTEPQHYDQVSALGYAMGYLGGGVLFAVNVAMTLSPESFGLADAAAAVKLSFVMVALWWALFSVPLALWVTEPDGRGIGMLAAVRGGFHQLRDTFNEIRALRTVFMFLLGYWCYIDGVDTIVRMAVDYGMSIGFSSDSLIVALLITQFIGFPAAIAFGFLGKWLGPKAGIYIAIAAYAAIVIWASRMESEIEFYGLAVAIGLVQGGIQSLSRSLYARIIPADKSAEFFGFYNMLGKFAAVIGPVMVGWAGVVSGSPRSGILTLLILFALGAFFLSRVDLKEGQRRAERLE